MGDCAAGDCVATQHELIQLGDQTCWDEGEALGIVSVPLELYIYRKPRLQMGVLGNIWIQQCEAHPDQLTLGMSGTW